MNVGNGLARGQAPGPPADGFRLHGIAAAVSECRGALAWRSREGVPHILAIARDRVDTATRSSLLLIDARSGETRQYWYPPREPGEPDRGNGDVFALLLARNGRLHTTLGSTFVEFDLEGRTWTFSAELDGLPMSFAEAPDGTVFCASYPRSRLFRFSPETRAFDDLGRLDPREQYPTSLVAGADGWVYAGIGTARSNLVAFNVTTKELRQLADEGQRQRGDGSVHLATDGRIYGRASSTAPWLRLEGGEAVPVEGNPPGRAPSGAIRWAQTLSAFPGGGRIVSFSLPDKLAEVELDGQVRQIAFDYQSNGAGVSSLVAGPDGRIYGSTNHPMHFFAIDPADGRLTDHGGIAAVGGGNFPAFAVSGQHLVAASYSAGALYLFDTTRGWTLPDRGTTVPASQPPAAPNPRLLGRFPEISRPRAALALPDGRVLLTGYGGYGVTGGGIVTYDPATQAAQAIPADRVLPGHSPIALRCLDPSTVVGATSVTAPGGGMVVAEAAEIFLWDAATQTVQFRVAPVPEARLIPGLEVGADERVYGLTNTACFFVFDPKTREVVHRADWSAWGTPFSPGHPLWRAEDGTICALLPRRLLRVQPDFTAEPIAEFPVDVTAGGVSLGGRLYVASGPQVYSVRLP